MKKISFIASMALVLLVTSCSKDLNQIPISTQTTATFYQQPSDFIQGINAAYNSLRNYPDRLLDMSEIRSDNIYPTNSVARDPDAISNFSTSIAGHPYVEEAWSTDFRGIFQANTVLDQIAKNGSFVGSAALATRLSAEARFLRAFYYFDLVRYFGKLPIIDHPVSISESTTIGRSPVADVYTLIIADLQFAIANLPANYAGAFPSYTATDVGRATKYAAEAVLGQVYMTRSGPTYGISGPGLGLNEWSLAVPLFNDIINSGLFVFNTSYSNIFSYTNQSPNYTATGNREAIFDVMYLTGQNPVLGADFTWQLIPQNYFNSQPAGNTPANGNLGTPSVSPNMLAEYSASDVRKTQNVFTAGYTYQGTLDPYPFFRKYVPYLGTGALDAAKIPASRFDWGINFIAIRYTDILMLKAECILNGAPGNQLTDVDGVVNQVRNRAGLLPLVNVNADQLLAERRREFAAEGLRWFDLQRSGKLLTIMNAWKAVDDAVIQKMGPITANSIIYPVPQSQLDTAPGLYSPNPGY
ncbi:RagB/SusD family nutrient uptake outer membrane protein [Mucilaginibacter sp. HMF5004]|uniref:RagB/SusD family nutrient uptake outer membrane protein n=1 Tax=Mucilaginibacter rivuli TaxID=2857527 RepID=UPI001C5EF900|nr:RagB/SusD family nutrient uptake outer membrane protein [Mucilaginibacter rivuli]MBW4889140.1 RagB/SusD family nutrient uptake outer membrane protein [Mucilaginibacter rivuli]